MIKSISTEVPEIFRRDSDGSTVFRWDIQQIINDEGNTQYEANECRICTTPTQENIERGAIEAYCSLSTQAVLLHDNNKSIANNKCQTVKYAAFLAETKKIKQAVQDYFDSMIEHDEAWVTEQAAAKLAQAKADKKIDLQAEKVKRRDAGIVINDILWDTDANAQIMYTQFATVGLAADPAMVVENWKASPGVFTEMSAAVIYSIIPKWIAHSSSITSTQKAKENEIDTLTTLADVDAYDISGGWD
jgi:hypothetical protein